MRPTRNLGLLACSWLLIAAPTPAHGLPAGERHIAGGRTTKIDSVPWQVRLHIRGGAICGGALLSDRQVATAAHCTYLGSSRLPATAIRVVTGSSSFDADSDAMRPNGPETDDPVSSKVSRIRRHPRYIPTADGSTSIKDGRNDVAVLELETPVPLDGVVRRAIQLPARNRFWEPGTRLTVSGFGLRNENANWVDGRLRRVTDMKLLDPAAHSGPWNASYVAATSRSGLDCSGDSGGPLVLTGEGEPVLVGLVSFSPNCRPGTTSTYTNVAAGEIQDFLLGDDTPPRAPVGGQNPQLTADRSGRLPLNPGRKLMCDPGRWTGSPEFTYTFRDDSSRLLQTGPVATYTVREADRGTSIFCQATARGNGGTGRSARSPRSAEIGARRAAAGRGRISVAIGLRPGSLQPGQRFTVTLRLRSSGRSVTRRIRACLTIPRRFSVVIADDMTRDGDLLCFSEPRLPAGYYLEYLPVLRVVPGRGAGAVRLRFRGEAENAAASAVSETVEIARP